MILQNPSLNAIFTLIRGVIDYDGWRLARLIVLVLGVSLIEGFGLALLVPFAALIFADSSSTSLVVSHAQAILSSLGLTERDQQIWALSGALFLLFIVRAAAISYKDIQTTAFHLDFIRSVRMDLYAALAAAPWPHIAQLDRSETLAALSEQINKIQAGVSFLFRASTATVQLIVLVSIAIALSPALTLIVFALAGLVAGVTVARLSSSHMLGARSVAVMRGMMFEAGAFLSGLKVAKAYGREADFVDRYASSVDETRDVAMRFSTRQIRLSRTVELIVAGITGGVLIFGLQFNGLDPEILVGLTAVFVRAAPQFLAIAQGLQLTANSAPALAAALKIKEQMTDASATMTNARARTIDYASIRLEGLHVFHDPAPRERPILVIETLSLPRHGLVLLTGPSGAGKSTLLDTLCGLRPAQRGSVYIGDAVLSADTLKSWSEQIAYLPQEPFLFNASVRDNLAWPANTLEDAAAWRALERSGAARLVKALPDQLNQRIGEAGIRLSGGERQRLCLARMLARDAKAYFLDEPTAHLDAAGELGVFQTLKSLSTNALVLVSTHSQGLHQHADMIVDLVDGAVTQIGPGEQTSMTQ